MTLELIVTEKELQSERYDVRRRRLNSQRFNIQGRIDRHPLKSDGENVFSAVEQFFMVQAAAYRKLESYPEFNPEFQNRSEPQEQTGSQYTAQDAICLATILAAHVASESLGYHHDQELPFFGNKKIDYATSFPDPVLSAMEVYRQALDEQYTTPLEAITEAFFIWSHESAKSKFAESGKEMPIKSIMVKGDDISTDILMGRTQKRQQDGRQIDVSSYIVQPSTRPAIAKTSPENTLENNIRNNNRNGSGTIETGIRNNRTSNRTTYRTMDTRTEAQTEARNDRLLQSPAEFIYGHDQVKAEFARLKEIARRRDYFTALFEPKRLFMNYLLVGPPGTGKTTLIDALARDVGMAFMKVPCVELGSEYFSRSATNIHEVYRAARRLKGQESPAGVIIFFDEIDHISKARGYDHSGQSDSLVTTLNENLDGGSSSEGIITIGATNVEHLIDPALRSRFKSLYLGYPQSDEEVIGIHTAIIKKMERYADQKLFGEIDFKDVLPFSHQDDRYRSGRTIDKIMYAAAISKALATEEHDPAKVPLVQTADLLKEYRQFQLEKDNHQQKGSQSDPNSQNPNSQRYVRTATT